MRELLISCTLLVATVAQGRPRKSVAPAKSIEDRIADYESRSYSHRISHKAPTYPRTPFQGERGAIAPQDQLHQAALKIACQRFPGYDVLSITDAPRGVRLQMVPRPGRWLDVHYGANRNMQRESFSLVVPTAFGELDRAAIEAHGLIVERAFSAPLTKAEAAEQDWIRKRYDPARLQEWARHAVTHDSYDYTFQPGTDLEVGDTRPDQPFRSHNENGDLLFTVLFKGPHVLVVRPRKDEVRGRLVFDIRREDGPLRSAELAHPLNLRRRLAANVQLTRELWKELTTKRGRQEPGK